MTKQNHNKKPYIYRELYVFVDVNKYMLHEDNGSERAVIRRLTKRIVSDLNVVGVSALKDYSNKKTDTETKCIKIYQYGDEFRSTIKSNKELFKKTNKVKRKKEDK